jgi:hypothetical protein
MYQVSKENFYEQDKAFSLKPAYGVKDLSKKDLIYLNSYGVSGILDDINKAGEDVIDEERQLSKNFDDLLKASKIKV